MFNKLIIKGVIINIYANYFSKLNKRNQFAHFFKIPTLTPFLPVVLVCCPLTLSPQKCLNPLWDLIFFNLSKSSLNLVSKLLEAN